MARAGGKTGGKNFAKGNQYGKATSVYLTPEERKVVKLTKTAFKKSLMKYLSSTKSEVEEFMADETIPMLDVLILRVLQKAINEGDERRLQWFCDQLFGKPKKLVDITTKGRAIVPDYSNISKDDLEKARRLLDSESTINDDGSDESSL